MKQLDAYYRALVSYRGHTAEDNGCSSLRAAIAEADTESDKIQITRAFCTIDEDWVNAIETGLVHVEKAIKQERQFIRSNGEVIEIEKVKHVSKETVEHLSRHSNLISRYEEGEDIVPDKLYTVERLNDYTVYENRFLYMLLCYLRDFITIRYNDILDLTNKYDAQIELDKKISTGKEKMTYKLSMHDVRRDDKYLKENNPAREIIDRIDLILKAVFAFLSTPLMQEVAKAPMLKPPITKTNVLKMDNDFKGAVALYSYIIAYDKPGYTVEHEVKNLAPFTSELADELAEAGGLVSFLAYEYGLGIKEDLKENYARYEAQKRAEEIERRAERIATLKRKLKNSGTSVDEYILELEQHVRDLEGEASRAGKLEEEIYGHVLDKKRLAEERDAAYLERDAISEELEETTARHFEEMNEMKRAHEDAMHDLIMQHESELFTVEKRHREELGQLRDDFDRERADLEGKIEEIRTECETLVKDAEERKAVAESTLLEEQTRIAGIVEERDLANARVKALGGIEYDFTDKESFTALEKEYNAFRALYKEQWSKTKRAIFKKHINKENINIESIRGKKGKDE